MKELQLACNDLYEVGDIDCLAAHHATVPKFSLHSTRPHNRPGLTQCQLFSCDPAIGRPHACSYSRSLGTSLSTESTGRSLVRAPLCPSLTHTSRPHIVVLEQISRLFSESKMVWIGQTFTNVLGIVGMRKSFHVSKAGRAGRF